MTIATHVEVRGGAAIVAPVIRATDVVGYELQSANIIRTLTVLVERANTHGSAVLAVLDSPNKNAVWVQKHGGPYGTFRTRTVAAYVKGSSASGKKHPPVISLITDGQGKTGAAQTVAVEFDAVAAKTLLAAAESSDSILVWVNGSDVSITLR